MLIKEIKSTEILFLLFTLSKLKLKPEEVEVSDFLSGVKLNVKAADFVVV